MEDKYIPPYEITDEMLELVSEIMENLGKLSGVNELEKLPRLRRVSRIKSIHSSLAIGKQAARKAVRQRQRLFLYFIHSLFIGNRKQHTFY